MERPNPQSPTEIDVDFLKAAKADGAIDRYKYNQKYGQITRNVNILTILRGTQITGRELAVQYRTSYQRISQIASIATRGIWRNCTNEIKTKYPLESLGQRKQDGDRATLRLSQEKAAEVDQLLASGKKIKDVANVTGLNFRHVSNIKRTKHESKKGTSKAQRETIRAAKSRIEEIILNSDDLAHVQSAIDILQLKMAIDVINKNPENFTSLAKIFKTSPMRHVPEVANTLIENGFPVIRISRGESNKGYPVVNYYLRKKDLEKIKSFLEEETGFSPNKHIAEIYSGDPPVNFPTTMELQHEYKAIFIGVAKRTNNFSLKARNLTVSDVLSNCPVTIINYYNHLLVAPNDYQKMQEFLRTRLTELGLPLNENV